MSAPRLTPKTKFPKASGFTLEWKTAAIPQIVEKHADHLGSITPQSLVFRSAANTSRENRSEIQTRGACIVLVHAHYSFSQVSGSHCVHLSTAPLRTKHECAPICCCPLTLFLF